jgi:hypothetical protein
MGLFVITGERPEPLAERGGAPKKRIMRPTWRKRTDGRSASERRVGWRSRRPTARWEERHANDQGAVSTENSYAWEGEISAQQALVDMNSVCLDPDVIRFVFELVNTGSMLSGVASNLIDGLPDDAYPGEAPGAVVLEMLCGTIATALESVDPRDVRRATELISLAGARTIEHLQLASELSRRMHGEDDGRGRAYG